MSGRHHPGPGKWPAWWLLYPQRYLLGFDGSNLDALPIAFELTARGWCEAYGMSGPVAEALNPVSRESCPQQPWCTCSFLGEQLCPHYLRLREMARAVD